MVATHWGESSSPLRSTVLIILYCLIGSPLLSFTWHAWHWWTFKMLTSNLYSLSKVFLGMTYMLILRSAKFKTIFFSLSTFSMLAHLVPWFSVLSMCFWHEFMLKPRDLLWTPNSYMHLTTSLSHTDIDYVIGISSLPYPKQNSSSLLPLKNLYHPFCTL